MGESHEGPTRVVVAEACYLVREFLTTLLTAAPEVELAAVCSDADELRAVIAAENPDVVLTGIRMPPSGTDEGIRIATRLRETHPKTGVVVLSQYAEPSYALDLLGQGSSQRAYLLKERIRTGDEVMAAIKAVSRGRSVIDPMILDVLIQARLRATRSRVGQLTAREREVLAEVATGKSNGAIADSLLLTKRAVEKHVNAIFAKLDLAQDPDVSRRVMASLIFLSETEGDLAPKQGPGRHHRETGAETRRVDHGPRGAQRVLSRRG